MYRTMTNSIGNEVEMRVEWRMVYRPGGQGPTPEQHEYTLACQGTESMTIYKLVNTHGCTVLVEHFDMNVGSPGYLDNPLAHFEVAAPAGADLGAIEDLLPWLEMDGNATFTLRPTDSHTFDVSY